MLTSFFGKSKPLNGIVVAFFMTLIFVVANFKEYYLAFNLAIFFEKLAVLLALLLSVYVLNFIAKKNELTRRSAYKILFFAVFTTSFFALLNNTQVIFANLCILFAFRRILSLRSKKIMQKKVFDATFWICIASIFYFWSILFLVVVFAGILFYLPKFKNWLIPLVAFLAVYLLNLSFHLLAYENIYGFAQWYEPVNFDFSNYRDLSLLIPLSLILAVLIWTLGNFLGLLQKASISLRPSLNLVLFSLVVSIAIAIFSPIKDGSELIFFFIPLSIIASTWFERKKDKVFKEILLAILILMPLLLPFIN
ncbi:MAG: DUF6427 family protein [Salegentibacter sp.]|uniref:DUF6427 family protein n=1 Tax=Salegentibacter sp. TaxID=1903072 RepID=UPI0028701ED6|nr:DUF6427 family protein [Salegentibacter sp.]MDR9458077.1 DUF6427 family protein [Salegentibacter sp.]